jgi:hypothetical protein
VRRPQTEDVGLPQGEAARGHHHAAAGTTTTTTDAAVDTLAVLLFARIKMKNHYIRYRLRTVMFSITTPATKFCDLSILISNE